MTVYSDQGDTWRERRKEGIDRWFMAIGTGKEFAEKVLDDGYDFNFDDQSACQLAFKAVQAGIKHDSIYSGGRPIGMNNLPINFFALIFFYISQFTASARRDTKSATIPVARN